jgi:hypothetical protein
MPGLADALNSHKALSVEDATRRNAVEEFSDALVNTLPKDAAAAAAAHGGIGDTLLRKQQQHNALLQCLQSAGLLAGAYEVRAQTFQCMKDCCCTCTVFYGISYEPLKAQTSYVTHNNCHWCWYTAESVQHLLQL